MRGTILACWTAGASGVLVPLRGVRDLDAYRPEILQVRDLDSPEQPTALYLIPTSRYYSGTGREFVQ
jgi:hypothetical protein